MLTTPTALLILENVISGPTANSGAFLEADVFMGLFTAISDAGPATTLSDLTLPAGALADATAVGTWGTPYPLDDGSYNSDQAPIQFSPGVDDEPLTILGWYLSSATASGNLLEYEYLPTPVLLTYGGAPLTIIKRLTVDPTGTWDTSVTYDG